VTFRNPILGAGGSTLLRPAIQSPNYLTGVRGWAVKRDGSAEFNNIVIRGGTVVSGIALYYDGTPALGNLILSIAAAAGVDSLGNAYAAGLTLYSSDGTINLNGTAATWNAIPSGAGIQIVVGGGAVIEQFAPSVVGGVTWDDGGIGATLASRLGTNTPQTFVSSPNNDANPGSSASISLYGSPQTSNGDVLSEAVVTAARLWANVNTGWISGAWAKIAETWHTPSFNTNWLTSTSFNGLTNWAGVQYRFDAEDNVWITGCFKSGATAGGTAVFQLPVGYRPTKQAQIPIIRNNAGTLTSSMVQISAAGNLNLQAGLGIGPVANAEYLVNGRFPLGNLP
jgi:hypothetical protein